MPAANICPDNARKAPKWSYREEFNRMVQEETKAWSQLGVAREPAFMIPPSGPLNAAIACHLHCPSFTVVDPYRQDTADETNVCIKQLLDIGFTVDQCLLYDHLPRREAVDGLQLYPLKPDLNLFILSLEV